ncbi:hypothetical protein E2C01_094184 [Portunus trituberculatus]|uniref:Uncharacterized protein n=1 Tax=Portunus trituberculatus TaxID=210409 RepID=A0A5B7JRT0_PORTR|nr:hypothetical protein [Portunus trituberculatus]
MWFAYNGLKVPMLPVIWVCGAERVITARVALAVSSRRRRGLVPPLDRRLPALASPRLWGFPLHARSRPR